MIKAGQIDKGTALLIKGQPFICVEREFVNPGKGSAFVRLKLKSPTTGQVLQETIKSQDSSVAIAAFIKSSAPIVAPTFSSRSTA